MKKWIIGIGLLFLCAGCQSVPVPTATPTAESANKPCDALDPCEEETIAANMQEYTGLQGEHVFVQIEYRDLLSMIEEKETAVIYLGRPTCPWCQEAVPILNAVAKEYDSSVYYVNTRSDYSQSTAGTEDRNALVEFMEAVLDENEEGEKTLYIPDVLFLKEGQIVANHIGTAGDYDAHERTMNEEEIAELTQIYRDAFALLN